MYSKHSRLLPVLLPFLALLCLNTSGLGQSGEFSLEPNKPVERTLKGGEAHAYRFKLRAGEYLHVDVDQRGIDVLLKISAPDGKTTIERDRPNGAQGPEALSFIALAAGDYRIEVKALDEKANEGKYEIKGELPRAPTATDRKRIEAETAFQDGLNLSQLQTPTSLTRAYENYELAVRAWGEVGDEYAEGLAQRSQLQALSDIGGMNIASGEHQRAVERLTQAIQLASKVGDRNAEASALNIIAIAHLALGQFKEALVAFEKALPIWDEVGDMSGKAFALAFGGGVYFFIGETQKSLDYLDQALKIGSTADDKLIQAMTLNLIGRVHFGLGESQRGLEEQMRALALARAAGNKGIEASVLNDLGTIYLDANQPEKARASLEDSLSISRTQGDRAGEATALSVLGRAYSALGDKLKALEYLNQALELCRIVGSKTCEVNSLSGLGDMYSSIGESKKASEYFHRSLSQAREIGDKRRECLALMSLGATYTNTGEPNKALEYLHQSLALARTIGDRSSEALTLVFSGMAYSLQGERERSVENFESGLRIAKTLDDKTYETLALNLSGLMYCLGGDAQKGIEASQQALALARTNGDKSNETFALNIIGEGYLFLGKFEAARKSSGEALALADSINDKRHKAFALNIIGSADYLGGKSQLASQSATQALLLARETGDRANEALALVLLGRISFFTGQPDKALDYFNESLAIYRASGSKSNETIALNHIAIAYFALDQPQESLKYLNQSLPIARATKDKRNEAVALIVAGGVHSVLGDSQKSLDELNAGLLLLKSAGDRSNQALAHFIFGKVYTTLGEPEKAFNHLNQALALTEEDKENRVAVLNQMAEVYFNLGESAKALEYLEQALPLSRQMGDKFGEIGSLNRFGLIYSDLGQFQISIEYLNQALQLSRVNKSGSFEAMTLSALGRVYVLREPLKSLEFSNRALPALRAAGRRNEEASTLNNIGLAYYLLLDHQNALSYFNKALSVSKETGDKNGETVTVSNIGITYLALGQQDRALESLTRALQLATITKDKSKEAVLLSNVMVAWHRRSKPSLAVFYGKQAVNKFQQLRGTIQRLDRGIQQTFLKSVSENYRYLASVLIELGRLPEAQQVLAMLKDQEYFDFVRRDSGEADSLTARATLTSEEAALQAEYNKLADEVTRIGRERGELFTKTVRTAAEEQNLSRFEEQLNIATDHFQKFLEQLQVRLGVRSEQAARVGEVQDALGMQKSLRELGDGAVLLYTLVSEDKYRIMLVTPDTQQAYENPINAAELGRKVLALREALQNPEMDPALPARDLYNILVGPKLAHDLKQAKAQTLMWSLDGVLRYVPVAALQDEMGKYLVESYRNVIFTPATRDRLKDTVAPNWKALGFGVSQSAEVELNGKMYTTKPLPGVTQELRSIIGEETNTSGPTLLRGRVLLDEVFTKQAMREALRQRYDLVHIASHFIFQPGNETDSFLLLGGKKDNKLTIAEIKRLSFEGVDLLTLSACETAMSGPKANGVEVESFGVLAQRQGAEAVMATLWPVADESTPLLMIEFYKTREKERLPKAEALRRAQLSLLRGTIKGKRNDLALRGLGLSKNSQKSSNETDAQVSYTHPYYWAPFILVGNWK